MRDFSESGFLDEIFQKQAIWEAVGDHPGALLEFVEHLVGRLSGGVDVRKWLKALGVEPRLPVPEFDAHPCWRRWRRRNILEIGNGVGGEESIGTLPKSGFDPPDGDHVGHALHEAPESEESHTATNGGWLLAPKTRKSRENLHPQTLLLVDENVPAGEISEEDVHALFSVQPEIREGRERAQDREWGLSHVVDRHAEAFELGFRNIAEGGEVPVLVPRAPPQNAWDWKTAILLAIGVLKSVGNAKLFVRWCRPAPEPPLLGQERVLRGPPTVVLRLNSRAPSQQRSDTIALEMFLSVFPDTTASLGIRSDCGCWVLPIPLFFFSFLFDIGLLLFVVIIGIIFIVLLAILKVGRDICWGAGIVVLKNIRYSGLRKTWVHENVFIPADGVLVQIVMEAWIYDDVGRGAPQFHEIGHPQEELPEPENAIPPIRLGDSLAQDAWVDLDEGQLDPVGEIPHQLSNDATERLVARSDAQSRRETHPRLLIHRVVWHGEGRPILVFGIENWALESLYTRRDGTDSSLEDLRGDGERGWGQRQGAGPQHPASNCGFRNFNRNKIGHAS